MHKCEFKTKDGKIIATSYRRVVIGGQGAYIEFDISGFVCTLITCPGQEWRGKGKYQYVKYFHLCPQGYPDIKVYHQRGIVNYADYLVGNYYISPNDLEFEGELYAEEGTMPGIKIPTTYSRIKLSAEELEPWLDKGPILSFDREYRFLSNFWIVQSIFYNGYSYTSVEAAFQAAKDPERAMEFVRLNPSDSKKLGKLVTITEDWNTRRLGVMEELLRQKFEAGSNLANQLLATGDRELIEGNYWHDNFWGNCTCPKCNSYQGQNLLGKLLMKIRTELKENRS